jgi:hypothetical protein
MQQRDLFDDSSPPAIVPAPCSGSIQERFEEFHRLNPWVYTTLEKIVGAYLARGPRRIGIRMAWEVMRWHYAMATTDPSSDFRTNDHYHSRYVRLLLERHPEWAGLFELRMLRAD